MSKRAVILAGGKGTRLIPYTISIPKPLVPIGDTPIIELLIKQLAKSGFTHVTITLNHLAEMLKDFCGDGSKWNLKIDYSIEEKPLSTMGPLRLISDLPENFLVINGDILTNLDFSDFFNFHIDNGNIFTVSTKQRDHQVDYGVLESNNEGKLISFTEKPILHYEVSMGVYMVNSGCLDLIPADTFYGFDHLMLDLIKNNRPASTKTFFGYWLDIGRPEDYKKACLDYDDGKINF